MRLLIIRGTTPTHTFTLPINRELCDKVRIIYSQGDTPIKVEGERLKFLSDNTVSCTLTQAETLSLDCAKPCDIQVRILTKDGSAPASDIIRKSVGRCLDDEVLT